MFNYDQLVNLFQSALKMGFAALATHGAMSSSNAELWSGVAGAAISWWLSHHSAATTPAGPPATASQDNTAKLPPTILCLFLALSIGMVGCVSGASTKTHVGILSNGFGYKQVTRGTNGVTTTNSFKFVIPISISNAVPLLMDAF